jgi:hypothetical protein
MECWMECEWNGALGNVSAQGTIAQLFKINKIRSSKIASTSSSRQSWTHFNNKKRGKILSWRNGVIHVDCCSTVLLDVGIYHHESIERCPFLLAQTSMCLPSRTNFKWAIG